ncbi:MAG: proton-conducting transporter membrane subunit [Armatimonadota bacterium]
MMETVGWQWYAGLALVLPVIGALAAAATSRRVADTIAVLAALGGFASVLAATASYSFVHAEHVLRTEVPLLPWLDGVGVGLLLDGLSVIMLVVALGIGVLVVLFSTGFLSPENRDLPTDRGKGRYYFWLLLMVAAMVALAMSPNLLQLLVALEVTTLCAWALVGHRGGREAGEASFRALLLNAAGGVLFAAGVAAVYAHAGELGFDALARVPQRAMPWVFGLMLVGAWAKAAQFPFMTWLAQAAEAVEPVSAYIQSVAPVKAAAFVMLRVVLGSWPAVTTAPALGIIVAAAAALTVLLALYLYLQQDDLRRLLAWLAVMHMGYIFFGIGLAIGGVWLGYQAALLHVVTHGFAQALLVLAAGSVAFTLGLQRISRLSGLSTSLPWTAFAFGVGLMAIAGIPPLSCFWSKFLLVTAAFRLGGATGVVLAVALLVEVVIGFIWLLRVDQRIFSGEPMEDAERIAEPPRIMTAVTIVLVIMALLAPLVVLPFMPGQPG